MRGSEVQSRPQIHSGFESSLGYTKPCLIQKQKAGASRAGMGMYKARWKGRVCFRAYHQGTREDAWAHTDKNLPLLGSTGSKAGLGGRRFSLQLTSAIIESQLSPGSRQASWETHGLIILVRDDYVSSTHSI